MKKTLFCLAVILILFGCDKTRLDIDRIKGELPEFQSITIDSIYLSSKNIYINFTDEFQLFQPHFHSELPYLLFTQLTDLNSISEIDQVHFICKMPQTDNDEFSYSINANDLIEGCRNRYLSNQLYTSLIGYIVNIKIVEDNRSALVLLNDRYGYILNDKKDNQIYNENIFTLIHEYSKECNNNAPSKYSYYMIQIDEELNRLTHPNIINVALMWGRIIEMGNE